MRPHRLGNTFPIFSHWVFGFSYQAAHVNSLAWVTLFRNICIPFFSYDVELCILFGRQKHSSSQFELHTHSHLLVVNINWKTRCYRTLIVMHTVTLYNDIMIENPAPFLFPFFFLLEIIHSGGVFNYETYHFRGCPLLWCQCFHHLILHLMHKKCHRTLTIDNLRNLCEIHGRKNVNEPIHFLL